MTLITSNLNDQNLLLSYVPNPASMCSKMCNKLFNIDNKIDRLFSATIATIAGGTSMTITGTWILSSPIESFCSEVKSSGLKALETIVPSETNEYLKEACRQVNGYVIPLAQTCESFQDKGLGAFQSLIPAEVEELMVNSCDLTLNHSVELNRICRGINEYGLAVFDHIGSYNLKDMTLKSCSIFDSAKVALLGVALTGVILTTYYAYRTCYPVRGEGRLITNKN